MQHSQPMAIALLERRRLADARAIDHIIRRRPGLASVSDRLF